MMLRRIFGDKFLPQLFEQGFLHQTEFENKRQLLNLF